MSGSSWIRRPLTPADPAARLFCVPHGGGGPSFFARWSAELAPDVEVCLVHLPGRESRRRESPLDDLLAIVREVVDAAQDLFDRPFAVLGHSMGSIIAYEVARSCGAEPRHLFVSASPAPDLVGEDMRIAHLSDADFLAEVRDTYVHIPDAIWDDAEMMKLVLPVLRADFTAYERYCRPAGRTLSCDVTALGGEQDDTVDAGSLAAWRHVTSARFEVRTFTGGHFYLAENRAAVQRVVRERILQLGQ